VKVTCTTDAAAGPQIIAASPTAAIKILNIAPPVSENATQPLHDTANLSSSKTCATLRTIYKINSSSACGEEHGALLSRRQ
jgi:hypothetical protein